MIAILPSESAEKKCLRTSDPVAEKRTLALGRVESRLFNPSSTTPACLPCLSATNDITSASYARPRPSLLPSPNPNVFTLCHLYASLGGARVVSARACASCSVPSRTKSRESHVPVLPSASGALTSFLSSIVSLKECRGNNPFRMLQVSLPLMFPTNVSPKNTCM